MVWRKGNPLTLLEVMKIGTITMENSMEVSYKTKNSVTIWSSKPTPGHISRKKKKTMVWKDTCTPVFTAALFTIAKTWEQPICPSADEQAEKVWHMYKMEYAAATAKSLQSCPTLCDPIEGSLPGSPVPGILQARTLEWVAISFSNG